MCAHYNLCYFGPGLISLEYVQAEFRRISTAQCGAFAGSQPESNLLIAPVVAHKPAHGRPGSIQHLQRGTRIQDRMQTAFAGLLVSDSLQQLVPGVSDVTACWQAWQIRTMMIRAVKPDRISPRRLLAPASGKLPRQVPRFHDYETPTRYGAAGKASGDSPMEKVRGVPGPPGRMPERFSMLPERCARVE